MDLVIASYRCSHDVRTHWARVLEEASFELHEYREIPWSSGEVESYAFVCRGRVAVLVESAPGNRYSESNQIEPGEHLHIHFPVPCVLKAIRRHRHLRLAQEVESTLLAVFRAQLIPIAGRLLRDAE